VKKLIISAICACIIVLLAASHGAIASSISRHSVSVPKESLLVVLAGFGCNLVNGQLVCGKSAKKNSENDNDDDADEHENSKKQKKHQDTDSDDGLTECTIQSPNSGMGCVAPLKLVCQKMKSGKKCCGCVGDNPKATTTPTPAAPTRFCCKATAIDRDNNNRTVLPAGCGATQAEAESALKSNASINHWDIQGAISCAPG
jgi:hypothetical protein